MLKYQKNKKFKFHTYISKKRFKGLKNTKCGSNKIKEGHLMSPQQREVFKCILSKPVREEYSALLLNLKQPLQTSIGKGNLIIITKTSQVKTICVYLHKIIVIFWLKISIFSLLVEFKDNNKFYKI